MTGSVPYSLAVGLDAVVLLGINTLITENAERRIQFDFLLSGRTKRRMDVWSNADTLKE